MSPAAFIPPALRRPLRDRWNRWRRPGTVLGPGCFIDREARLARGSVCGADCAVQRQAELLRGAVLGDRIVVGRRVRIGASTLAGDGTLEPDCEVYGSTLGDHVGLQRGARLTDVRLGRFSYVGWEAFLNGVNAGAFCSIGPAVLAGLGEHPSSLLTTSPAFYSTRRQCGATFAPRDTFAERRPIVIGADVWLGARAFVRDGVRIGPGAIVAAGAVVTQDVPAYAIMGGTPARLIRMRFPESAIARLLALAWWEWPADRLQTAQPLLASPRVEAFLDWAESFSAHAPPPSPVAAAPS